MNNAKLFLAGALCAGFMHASHAQTSLIVHGVSKHFSERTNGREWNEINTGLALRYDAMKDISLQAGFYKNSVDRTSTYALADWTPVTVGPVAVGVFAGAATGYEARSIQPIGGAVARVQFSRVLVAVRIAPKAGIGGSAVASVEAGFSF